MDKDLKVKIITFEEIPKKGEAISISIVFTNGEIFGSDDWYFNSRGVLEMYSFFEDEYAQINEILVDYVVAVYKEDVNV